MDSGDSVKNVDFSSRDRFKRIHPNSFLATVSMLTWIKTFCNPNAVYRTQLGIHMTYKVDPFHSACLPISAFSIIFMKKMPWKHPTTVAGKSNSTCRQGDGNLYLGSQHKANVVEKLTYGIDGELA